MKKSPLSEQSFYILLALIDEPLHGYGIIKRVKELSQGMIVLAAGTLYGAIEKLKNQQMIELDHLEDDGKRKVYRLTPQGLAKLNEDYLRLAQLHHVASQLLQTKEEF